MNFPLLHFVISVIIFFPILYYLVVPMMQTLTLNLFEKKFQLGGFNPQDYHGDDPVNAFDVIFTYMSFGIALALSMAVVIYAAEMGILPEIHRNK